MRPVWLAPMVAPATAVYDAGHRQRETKRTRHENASCERPPAGNMIRSVCAYL